MTLQFLMVDMQHMWGFNNTTGEVKTKETSDIAIVLKKTYDIGTPSPISSEAPMVIRLMKYTDIGLVNWSHCIHSAAFGLYNAT